MRRAGSWATTPCERRTACGSSSPTPRQPAISYANKVQQLLQQSWQDLGIKMTIKNLPPAVMWGDYWMQSQFDTGLAGIDFMSGPDPECSDYLRSTSTPAKGGSG